MSNGFLSTASNQGVMAYESPINVLWSDTKIEQLRDEYDNLIVRAVRNVCPQVDKDELIKALEYDRGQYEKGFADGLSFKPPVKSNYDRIRAMSVEEMAKMFLTHDEQIYRHCPSDEHAEKCNADFGKLFVDCDACWLDWLKQEVPELDD